MAVIQFENGFHGTYHIGEQTLKIGHELIQPYDMTYGAIASCFYATYLMIAGERNVPISDAVIRIDGRKRREVPTTLEYVKLRMVPVSTASREQLEDCMREALQKCSMMATIRQVAEVDAAIVAE